MLIETIRTSILKGIVDGLRSNKISIQKFAELHHIVIYEGHHFFKIKERFEEKVNHVIDSYIREDVREDIIVVRYS